MTRRRLAIVLALALLAAASGPALAQDPETRAFVERVVAAVNSKSVDARKALLHPKAVRCAGIAPELFYGLMVSRQSRDTIPADYTWKLDAIPAGEPPMSAERFDYPVRPTHMLQLTFTPAPSSSRTIVLQLVHEGKRWYEIVPCPKPATVTEARQMQQAQAKRAERVQALVAGMPPDLKAQLVEMLRAGRRLDAAKHYQATTGEDMTTSVEVVEQLAPR